MNLMVTGRAGGKTTAVIHAMAALTDEQRENAVCFTFAATAAQSMLMQANSMYPDKDWSRDNFTTITQYQSRHGRPQGKIYVDNVENCLASLLGARPDMLTLTLPE